MNHDTNLHFQDIAEDFFEVKNIINEKWLYEVEHPEELYFLFSPLNPLKEKIKSHIIVEKAKARIVCFFNPENKINDEQIAYFGYWETIDSLEINSKMFKECENWARDCGATKLIGPINFSTYNRYRLNLSSPSDHPFFNEPQNPEYYPILLENLGFKPLNEYVSYIVKDKEKIKNWISVYEQKKAILDFGYTFEKITPKVWMDNLEEIHKKSEIVFGGNFAFTPISIDLFKIKYGEFFSKLICPKTSIFVRKKDNSEIIGVLINFPNYNDLPIDQRNLSNLSYENYTRKIKKPTLLMKTIGIVDGHSHMGFLVIRMLLEIAEDALAGYDEFIFCLMQKDNYPSKLGHEFKSSEKKYALYSKDLR